VSLTLCAAGVIGALMASAPPTTGDDLLAYRLDDSLRPSGPTRWAAGGSLEGPAHLMPGGEVVGLVRVGERLLLARWGAEGRELSRCPVPLRGKVLDSVAAAGALVVVTEESVARVELVDGRVSAQAPSPLARSESQVAPLELLAGVPFADPNGQQPLVAAGLEGAWFATPSQRLFRVGLDGTTVERRLPLSVPAGRRNRVERMFATPEGDLVLVEVRATEHEVSGRGPDLASVLVLSRLDRRGEVVARAELGEERRRLEWFYMEDAGYGILPRAAGIVRSRWDGGTHLSAGSVDAAGLVLTASESVGSEGSRHRVVRLDASLRQRWSASLGDSGSAVATYPGGVLLYQWPATLSVFPEGGGAEKFARLPDTRDLPVGARAALGRGEGGGWIVVLHGKQRRPD
jgi:hypothetical protein